MQEKNGYGKTKRSFVLKPAQRRALRGREGADRVRLMTNAGEIVGRLHSAETGNAAILWVFGSGGGLGGPSATPTRRTVSAVRRHLARARLQAPRRSPSVCSMASRGGVPGEPGQDPGCARRSLVRGAVVVNAGASSQAVIAVAALSSQASGTDTVGDLQPQARHLYSRQRR